VAVRAYTAELRELTLQALEEVRNMARELRPSTLDDLGLVAAAQSYTERFAELVGFAVTFHTEGLTHRLAPQVELVLYRVIQEALTNVARHARARHVEVSFVQASECLVATVRDDGRGFDVDAVLASKERGLGLFGMQERMALIGGRLQLTSRPGAGARVRAEVPIVEPSPLGDQPAGRMPVRRADGARDGLSDAAHLRSPSRELAVNG
jgi:signal transduction histidine kinase